MDHGRVKLNLDVVRVGAWSTRGGGTEEVRADLGGMRVNQGVTLVSVVSVAMMRRSVEPGVERT